MNIVKKTCIITGVTGMDGSWMADYLLSFYSNYKVFGGIRRLSVRNHNNINHLKSNSNFELINFELNDPVSIDTTIKKIKPDYFFNFAANSFVTNSWDMPVYHLRTNAEPLVYILEAIRKYCSNCHLYSAGSTEEHGDVLYSPQDEQHPPRPRSMYGVSKCTARMILKVYRESYGLYAIQGWLSNHEGTRRSDEFVTRKISKAVARIAKGIEVGNKEVVPLIVGNIYTKRDWSDAEDFIDGIWRMTNQELFREDLKNKSFSSTPELSKELKEYALSSGEAHTVKEFIEEAFRVVNVEGQWVGSDLDEKYIFNNLTLVKIDPKLFRPADVHLLQGDSSLARNELKWRPRVSFKELVKKMVLHDIENFKS